MSQNQKDRDILVSFPGKILYVDKDEIIREIHEYYPLQTYFTGPRLKEICEKTEYQYFETVDNYITLCKFIGKKVSELEKELEKRGKRNKKARIKLEDDKKLWSEQLKKYGDVLLSVDIKGIDTFETGVNIFVLLNSKYSFEEQCCYVKKNKMNCIKFLSEELNRKRKTQILDLLKFCKISRIIVTRRNEVCFTFELKRDIQKLFEREDSE